VLQKRNSESQRHRIQLARQIVFSILRSQEFEKEAGELLVFEYDESLLRYRPALAARHCLAGLLQAKG